jgi:protein-S-isoprenylcysteine O-methyltransferase Ste14
VRGPWVIVEQESPMNFACLLLHSLWLGLELTPSEAARDLWILFALYWLVSALKRKKTKQRESIVHRMAYILPMIGVFYVLYNPRLHIGWLVTYFLPNTGQVQWAGVAVMVFGLGIACWARVHLGTNWSGVVTLKEGHELIRTGPYRNIRHPIYTGILIGFLGYAIVGGQVRGLVAMAVVWFSFFVKARHEEKFLAQEFGPKFEEHTQHTGMFLPKFS